MVNMVTLESLENVLIYHCIILNSLFISIICVQILNKEIFSEEG
jgi:hypothetical protein